MPRGDAGDAYTQKFGRRVAAARRSLGLSQRELAERAGIAEKYLSRVEVGVALPSVRIADRLAVALDLQLDVLVGRTREQHHDPERHITGARAVQSVDRGRGDM